MEKIMEQAKLKFDSISERSWMEIVHGLLPIEHLYQVKYIMLLCLILVLLLLIYFLLREKIVSLFSFLLLITAI